MHGKKTNRKTFIRIRRFPQIDGMTIDDFDSDDDTQTTNLKLIDWYENRLIILNELGNEFYEKTHCNICPTCYK